MFQATFVILALVVVLSATFSNAALAPDLASKQSAESDEFGAAIKSFLANGDILKQHSKSPASSLFTKLKASRPDEKRIAGQKKVLSAQEKVKKDRLNGRPDVERIARANPQQSHQLVIGVKPNNIKSLEAKLIDVSDPARYGFMSMSFIAKVCCSIDFPVQQPLSTILKIYIRSPNYGRHITREQLDSIVGNAHGNSEVRAFMARHSEVALVSETRNGEYLTFEGTST